LRDIPAGPRRFSTISIELPGWVEDVVQPGELIPDRVDRMRLAIRLALENLAQGTHGPLLNRTDPILSEDGLRAAGGSTCDDPDIIVLGDAGLSR
jgi:hypothetical protein